MIDEPLSNETRPAAGAAGASVATGSAPKRVLLLGLGNDILSDDAIGLVVARDVRRLLDPGADVDVIDTTEIGLSLLDLITGYEGLVIVDAVQTGKAPPGHLHEIEQDALKLLPRVSPHFLGVGEILALGRELGLAVPRYVKIFAVEVADPFTLSTELTPVIERVLPMVVSRVVATLQHLAPAGPQGLRSANAALPGRIPLGP